MRRLFSCKQISNDKVIVFLVDFMIEYTIETEAISNLKLILF